MYITRHMKGRMAKVLQNWPERDVRFICVSTGGRILGLGDICAYGIGIPIGKLQLYTACAAVPPSCLLPMLFDIGTTDDALRADPLYLGLREKPLSDQELDELTDEFVEAVQKVFPGCCIHFEDWKGTDAIRMLERYGDKVLCYNDDIQGTASVALAGLTTALQIIDAPLTEQRILFLGAGSAGIGMANLIASAMQTKGLSLETARSRTSMFDIDGLLEPSRKGLSKEQAVYAHKAPPAKRHVRELPARSVERLALGPRVSLLGGALGLLRWVGQREDDWPLVEPAHGLDHTLVEGAALRAHPYEDSRLNPLDRLDQTARPSTPVRPIFLHLPGHWAGDLRGTAAAAQRRMLHRRGSGERRPGWPRSPGQGDAVPPSQANILETEVTTATCAISCHPRSRTRRWVADPGPRGCGEPGRWSCAGPICRFRQSSATFARVPNYLFARAVGLDHRQNQTFGSQGDVASSACCQLSIADRGGT